MPHFDSSLTLKWPRSGQHLVKQHAGGKDICARVNAITPRLFWCGVRCCAIGDANFSYLSMVNSRRAGRVVIEKFCKAEIQYLHLPAWRNHDIAGLDVTMNNPASVRGSESIGCLQRDR